MGPKSSVAPAEKAVKARSRRRGRAADRTSPLRAGPEGPTAQADLLHLAPWGTAPTTGTSDHATALESAQIQQAQRIQLASELGRLQGNEHLQRLLVLRQEEENEEAPARGPAPAGPASPGAGIEMPPLQVQGSPLTPEEREFLRDIDFKTMYQGADLDYEKPEIARNESRPNIILEPWAWANKPGGLDLDARFEVAPAGAVTGSATCPAKAWPAGGMIGNRYDFFVTTGTVGDLNITMKLVFGSLKLTRPGGVFTIPGPKPVQKTLHVVDQRQSFLDKDASVVFVDEAGKQWNAGSLPADQVRYSNGRQKLKLWPLASRGNPGLALKVGYKVKRGEQVLKVQDPTPWPDGGQYGPTLEMVCGQVADDYDTYTFEIDTLKPDGSPARPPIYSPVVIHGWGVTEAEVKKLAERDQKSIDSVVSGMATDQNPVAVEACQAVKAKDDPLKVVPMTPCHDTAKRVRDDGRDPASYTAFFCGTGYDKIKIEGKNLGGLTYSDDEFGIVVTYNPASPTPIGSDAIKQIIVHEYVHIRDRRGKPWYEIPDDLWQYKTEFRAYWADGRYQQEPDAFDPALDLNGPNTPRSRAIFRHLYGSELLYGYVKKAYDKGGSFRDEVNNFMRPEGYTIRNPSRLVDLHNFLQAQPAVCQATEDWTLGMELDRLKAQLQPGDLEYIQRQERWRNQLAKLPGLEAASAGSAPRT